MTTRKPGAIPKSVFSVLGPIPVSEHEVIPNKDGTPSDDLGWFDASERTILLQSKAGFVQKHHTLIHEKVHMWFWDAGVNLPEDVEENLADVIATAILAEQLNR